MIAYLQRRQPEETPAPAPAPAAPVPRPFFSGGTVEKPNKFLGDFEGFYLEARTRSSNKLDKVRLCFRRGVESWYDINKTRIPLRGGFGRSSWSVSGCVSVQPVRSKPGCLHSGLLLGMAKYRAVADATAFGDREI